MKHLNLRMYAMVFALVCVWVIFTLLTGGTFLSTRNLSNLSRQAAVTAILAVGMTLVIVSANIDLSVGYGCRVARCHRSNCTRVVGATDPRGTHRCLMHRHSDGIDAGVPRGVSTNPSVYRYIGRIFGVSRFDVSVYQRRDHPTARQLAQSDRERLSFVNTWMGTYDRWIGYQRIPVFTDNEPPSYNTGLNKHP